MSWTLHCGDSAHILKRLDSNIIDLTITSPPYDGLRAYRGFVFDFESISKDLYRVTAPGGVVVWVVGDMVINGSESGTSFRQALQFMEIGFNLHDTMIYQKAAVVYPDVSRYHASFEYMFVFSKGKPKTINLIKDIKNKYWGNKISGTNRNPDGSLSPSNALKKGREVGEYSIRPNIWKYSVGYGKSSKDEIAFDHPAIFPEKLAHDHIISWSNPGDTILDPFAGSGTTLKMAESLGRNGIGIEISPEYVEIIKKRMAERQSTIFEEV